MSRFAGLKADIDHELKNLERLDRTLQDVLRKASSDVTEIETRAAGSLLHDFYTGLERIFQRIAVKIDQDLPSGEDWHRQLLQRMSIPLEGVRPAVITQKQAEHLEAYMGFRHVFRNIYGFELRWRRIEPLAENLGDLYRSLEGQLAEFKGFLDSLG
ncbi:MAG: hypothetical protein ABEL51_14270 [Salinibacter sp.]